MSILFVVNAIILTRRHLMEVTTMARAKSFQEDKALESAMLLFWENGYSATSMKALERAMGLNPTSIYNAFGSKRALFQRALELYFQTVLARFIARVVRAKSAQEALSGVLEEVIHLHFAKSNPGGCMVVLSLLEREQHDVKTKKMLDSALFQLRDIIIERLKLAQVEGEMDAAADCPGIANHVIALVTGMIAMAKAGFSKKELKALVNSSTAVLIEQPG